MGSQGNTQPIRQWDTLFLWQLPSFCLNVSCSYLLYVVCWAGLGWALWLIVLCDEGPLECFPSSRAFRDARIPNMFCAKFLPPLQGQNERPLVQRQMKRSKAMEKPEWGETSVISRRVSSTTFLYWWCHAILPLLSRQNFSARSRLAHHQLWQSSVISFIYEW